MAKKIIKKFNKAKTAVKKVAIKSVKKKAVKVNTKVAHKAKKIVVRKASKKTTVKAKPKKTVKKSNVSKKAIHAKTKSSNKKHIKGAQRKELMILPDHELENLPVFSENSQNTSQVSPNTNAQLNNTKELEVDFAALQKQFEGTAMPNMPAIDEKPKKKGFFARLFGKKEAVQTVENKPVLDAAPLKKDFDFASLQSNSPTNNANKNVDINNSILSAEDKKELFEDLNSDKIEANNSKKKVDSNTTEEEHFDLTPEKLSQMEVAPKTSIVSRFFSKKNKKSASENLPSEVKTGFKEDISEDLAASASPERREEMYLEEMYKKMDDEIRERHDHLNVKEGKISKKEKDLAKKEEEILRREFNSVTKEKEMDQIKKLKEDLENETISINYQKQKIEELKTELALKDAALREKEIELEKESKESKKLSKTVMQEESEVKELKTEVNEEDDAIEFLEQEIEKQKKEFEEKMKSVQMESLQTPDTITEIHNMINECYQELGNKNYASANKKYSEVRAKYISDGKKLDPKGEVYNEIIKLYQDISGLIKK